MLPMRGRSAELASLDDLLGSACRGHGGVVMVEGPPGIGKSRLLQEATRLAAEKTMVVASAGGDELDQLTPWGPVLTALTAATPAVLGRDELTGLDTFLDRRLEVPERMRSALERAASSRPVLVALDDLQWADEATLAVLGTLPHQLFSYPIVWLLARRPLPSSAQIQALCARLDAEGASRMRLGPLRADDAELVVADLVGGAPARPVLALVAQAGGNPLYLAELLRNADNRSIDAGSATLPPSLVTLVEAHLRLLSRPAREFLKVASVLGSVFSVTEVSAITGQPVGALLGAVEETIGSEVIVEQGDLLLFRHDLFRRAVYDELPQAVRPALHRDAGRALLSLGAPLTRAASHLAIGARAGDDQDIDALTRVAIDLFGTSPASAADLALRVVDLLGPLDPRRVGAVGLAVGLLGWAGRMEEARALGERHLSTHDLPAQLEADIYVGIHRAWAMRSLAPCPTRLPPRLLADPAVSAPTRADLILLAQLSDLWIAPESAVEATFAQVEQLELTDLRVLVSVREGFRVEHGRLLRALEEASAELPDSPSTLAGKWLVRRVE
jgi:hypothetical protein